MRQHPSPEQKAFLDELHKRKIDLCDWVWVLNVGGYVGESTLSEINYANDHGKEVRFLNTEFPDYVEPVDPAQALADRIPELKAELAYWKNEHSKAVGGNEEQCRYLASLQALAELVPGLVEELEEALPDVRAFGAPGKSDSMEEILADARRAMEEAK